MKITMRLNLKEKRNHRVKCDYGLKDYYRHYRKRGGKLSRDKFRDIIYTFNKGLYPLICSFDYEYKLPYRLGSICIIQKNTFVKMVDGVLQTNRPVNYKASLDMWEKDPQTRADNLFVRHEDPYIFNFVYVKKLAVYRNKSIYTLNVNRELKHYLREVIRENPNFKAQKKWN